MNLMPTPLQQRLLVYPWYLGAQMEPSLHQILANDVAIFLVFRGLILEYIPCCEYLRLYVA
ncbi:hypothetical protein LCGC14_2736810 [marine sediment metagenome]|uniref:Uncharacterized protein n=1 Tax=marine sediment metagenome TaxID=412755 RepID=A0A0F9BEJ4_9ZZZZ